MDAEKIKSALADVTAEQYPTLKSAKLASLCSALWAERGVELVVVGGSGHRDSDGRRVCLRRPRHVPCQQGNAARPRTAGSHGLAWRKRRPAQLAGGRYVRG